MAAWGKMRYGAVSGGVHMGQAGFHGGICHDAPFRRSARLPQQDGIGPHAHRQHQHIEFHRFSPGEPGGMFRKFLHGFSKPQSNSILLQMRFHQGGAVRLQNAGKHMRR